MKVILSITLIAAIAGFVAATPTGQTASIPNPEPAKNEPESFPILQLSEDLHRFRKSYGSGGGGSVPSPPCPKNYLFSCRPNLSPVPCASGGGGGYGSSGAYTAPIPVYLAPMANNFNGAWSQLQQR